MVKRTKGRRVWGESCTVCHGNWIVKKRNGAFRIPGKKSWRRGDSGRGSIRVHWPVIERHVPAKGQKSVYQNVNQRRMRQFAICPKCGQDNLNAQAKRSEDYRRRMGYLPPLSAVPGYDPPKRTRDFSGDADKRKTKARRHKARQARR